MAKGAADTQTESRRIKMRRQRAARHDTAVREHRCQGTPLLYYIVFVNTLDPGNIRFCADRDSPSHVRIFLRWIHAGFFGHRVQYRLPQLVFIRLIVRIPAVAIR